MVRSVHAATQQWGAQNQVSQTAQSECPPALTGRLKESQLKPTYYVQEQRCSVAPDPSKVLQVLRQLWVQVAYWEPETGSCSEHYWSQTQKAQTLLQCCTSEACWESMAKTARDWEIEIETKMEQLVAQDVQR